MWEKTLEYCNNHNYHYFIWNIFTAKSSFVSEFNWDRWFEVDSLKRYSNQKHKELTNRNVFAGFSIKLDSQLNKLELNDFHSYFNFPHYFKSKRESNLKEIILNKKNLFTIKLPKQKK